MKMKCVVGKLAKTVRIFYETKRSTLSIMVLNLTSIAIQSKWTVIETDKIPFINSKTIVSVPADKFKLQRLHVESGKPGIEQLVFLGACWNYVDEKEKGLKPLHPNYWHPQSAPPPFTKLGERHEHSCNDQNSYFSRILSRFG